MTKYNQSFKQPVFEFYLQNGKNRPLTHPYFQLAENTCLYFGITNSGNISQWLQIFDKQDINGLLFRSEYGKRSSRKSIARIISDENIVVVCWFTPENTVHIKEKLIRLRTIL